LHGNSGERPLHLPLRTLIHEFLSIWESDLLKFIHFRPLILLLGMALSAHAEVSQFQLNFEKLGSQIPKRLNQIGLGQFAGFDARELSASINDHHIPVKLVPWITRPEPVGTVIVAGRFSAQWYNDETGRYIEVNQTLWPSTPAVLKPVIALHEYVGVLSFFNDHDYEASLAMWLLTLPKTKTILTEGEIQGLVERIRGQLVARGGISGVGGGGDEFAVLTKMNLLKEALANVARKRRGTEARREAVDNMYGWLYIKTERGSL
jgi:hypothetical protein